MAQPSVDAPMTEPSFDPFANLTIADKQELLLMLQEKRKSRATACPPATNYLPVGKSSVLPKWNGKQEDFKFFMDRLRIRVENEMGVVIESSSICIDIVDTLPDEKKSRIASWFSLNKGKETGSFNWKELLDVIQREFEDAQAQQVALELLQRMEQGPHQYFHEFLKEFEYKAAFCGGDEMFTPSAMTRQLKSSLNNSLRRSLIGVKLPPVKQYAEWVAAVREVAEELESFSDYRPRGSNQIGTKIGPAKGGIGLSKLENRNPKVDGAGDTHMTGTDAILAAIRDLKVNYSGSSTDYPARSSNNPKYRSKGEDGRKTKPRAPWRSKKRV